MPDKRDNILRALEEDDKEESCLTLRDKALARAKSEQAAKALTAWEWLEWYELHGEPEVRSQLQKKQQRLWQFWKRSKPAAASLRWLKTVCAA